MNIYLTKKDDYWIARDETFKGMGFTQQAAVISLINISHNFKVLVQQPEWKHQEL